MIFNFKHHHLHVNIKASGWGTSNIYTWPVLQLEVWYNGVSREGIQFIMDVFWHSVTEPGSFFWTCSLEISASVNLSEMSQRLVIHEIIKLCGWVLWYTTICHCTFFFSIRSLITQIASSIIHKCFVAPDIASNICVGKVWLHKYWCFHQQENFNAFGSQLGSNENLTSPNWNLTTSIAMYRMSIFRSRLFPRNLWE